MDWLLDTLAAIVLLPIVVSDLRRWHLQDDGESYAAERDGWLWRAGAWVAGLCRKHR